MFQVEEIYIYMYIYIYRRFVWFVLLPKKKVLCKKMSTSHWFPSPTPYPAKDGCIHLLNDELEKLQSITPLGAVAINGIAALPGDPWMKGRCVFGTGNWENSETITKHHRLRMTLRWYSHFLFTCDTRLPLSGKICQCHLHPVWCLMFFEFQQSSAKENLFQPWTT